MHHATAIAFQRTLRLGEQEIDLLVWLEAIFKHVSYLKVMGEAADWDWKACSDTLHAAMIHRYPALAEAVDEKTLPTQRLDQLDPYSLEIIKAAIQHVEGSSFRDETIVDALDLLVPLLQIYEAVENDDGENLLAPLGLTPLSLMLLDRPLRADGRLHFTKEDAVSFADVFPMGMPSARGFEEEEDGEGDDELDELDKEENTADAEAAFDENADDEFDPEFDYESEVEAADDILSDWPESWSDLTKDECYQRAFALWLPIVTAAHSGGRRRPLFALIDEYTEAIRAIPGREEQLFTNKKTGERYCFFDIYALHIMLYTLQWAYYEQTKVFGHLKTPFRIDFSEIEVPDDLPDQPEMPLILPAALPRQRHLTQEENNQLYYLLQQAAVHYWKNLGVSLPENIGLRGGKTIVLRDEAAEGQRDDKKKVHVASEEKSREDTREAMASDTPSSATAAGKKKLPKLDTDIPESLYAMTTNLTALARQGKLDPLIGREAELEQIFFIMSCRRKNKPLILGASGIGKTALVEGLAQRIVSGDVPQFLRDYRILRLHTESLASRYKGGFAEKLNSLIKGLTSLSKVVLFVDDAHRLIDSPEDTSKEQIHAIEELLTQARLPIILASNFEDWRQSFSKNATVNQRLTKIELAPLSREESVRVLKGLQGQYEAFHHVTYGVGVVEDVVKLSDRFIVDRVLPDKAVDVLDQLAARARLNYEKAHPDEDLSGKTLPVDVSLVPHVIANLARLPLEQVQASDKTAVKDLEKTIKSTVFGQDEAVKAIVSAIKVARSGLNQSERPLGSFLFTGPTGVGKTEVARQLAKALNVPLLRFDMSEYSESHTVSRLIGAPAGYVGYGEGGLLTEKVTKHPYSVVLLDEIEKAHPRLFNLLLQVMDHGTLTDASGREADFRNVVLIMTSNVGARDGERQAIGFGGEAQMGDISAALKQAFTPEFRNRFDAIIRFLPLNNESLYRVVDKFLGELTARLAERGVKPIYTDAFKAFLVRKGYVPSMGARPMRRLIDDQVRRPLADELLFGALMNGGTVTIDMGEDDEVRFTYESGSSEADDAAHA